MAGCTRRAPSALRGGSPRHQLGLIKCISQSVNQEALSLNRTHPLLCPAGEQPWDCSAPRVVLGPGLRYSGKVDWGFALPSFPLGEFAYLKRQMKNVTVGRMRACVNVHTFAYWECNPQVLIVLFQFGTALATWPSSV